MAFLLVEREAKGVVALSLHTISCVCGLSGLSGVAIFPDQDRTHVSALAGGLLPLSHQGRCACNFVSAFVFMFAFSFVPL